MHCRRCRIKMRLSPTVHHGKRKWICPSCGRARMENPKPRRPDSRRRESRRRARGRGPGRDEDRDDRPDRR